MVKMEKEKLIKNIIKYLDEDSHINWFFSEYEDIVNDKMIDDLVKEFSKYLKEKYIEKK